LTSRGWAEILKSIGKLTWKFKFDLQNEYLNLGRIRVSDWAIMWCANFGALKPLQKLRVNKKA